MSPWYEQCEDKRLNRDKLLDNSVTDRYLGKYSKNTSTESFILNLLNLKCFYRLSLGLHRIHLSNKYAMCFSPKLFKN